MTFFIDCADPSAVAGLTARYPVAGITTNPTILSREKAAIAARGVTGLLRDLRAILGENRPIFYQLTQYGAGSLVRDGDPAVDTPSCADALETIRVLRGTVGGKFVWKIAAHGEGFRLMEELASAGERDIAATAVFSAGQAMLASAAGARYVAPFVNRTIKAGGDGIGMVREILSVLDPNVTSVLAASLGSAQQIVTLASLGVPFITLPPALFDELSAHPMADDAVVKFRESAGQLL